MQPEQTPFKPLWFSVDLPGYRNPLEHEPYLGFDYYQLPPLDQQMFNGTLEWLVPLSDKLALSMSSHQGDEKHFAKMKEHFEHAQEQAHALQLSFPKSFTRLMTSRDLQRRIPSALACYFYVSENLIPLTEGYALQFLNEQQSIEGWYLYLKPNQTPSVICVHGYGPTLEEDPKPSVDEIFYAAPSFEEFIYRFWLENHIWFALNAKQPLTHEQQAYCDHYALLTGNNGDTL